MSLQVGATERRLAYRALPGSVSLPIFEIATHVQIWAARMLWKLAQASTNPVLCQDTMLRVAVSEEVSYRVQQLNAENNRLWLFAMTHHQHAVASAQALQVRCLPLVS